MPHLLFNSIFKQFGVYMTLDDQKDFFDFMSLGATKNHYNLENLSKIFDILAKVTYKTQKESMRQKESLTPGKDKFMALGDEQYARFVTNLQKKVSLSFNNSASNAIAFFDLSGHEQLRIDEFLFGVEFFVSGNRLKDCLMLFEALDVNKDGMLDEFEFEGLFSYRPGQEATLETTGAMINMQDSIGGEKLGNYISGGYNTYNKRPLQQNEILQLPQYMGQVLAKLEMRRRCQDVGQQNNATQAFL